MEEGNSVHFWGFDPPCGGRFVHFGVSKAQLKMVSYGKEHPLCAAHDEDCWAKNRRAAPKSKEGKR